MKSQYEMVKEFQQAFGHPVAEVPGALEVCSGLVEGWHTLDLKDCLEAMKTEIENENMGKRHFRARLMLEELIEFMESDDLIGQVDAMLDLLYFVNGTLVEMGVDPEKPFAMVHAANMRKLWPDGKPRWNAEGKVIKPDGWVGPEDELRHYIESLEEE